MAILFLGVIRNTYNTPSSGRGVILQLMRLFFSYVVCRIAFFYSLPIREGEKEIKGEGAEEGEKRKSEKRKSEKRAIERER